MSPRSQPRAQADPRSAALYHRWLADVLSAADGQPDDARASMFTRMAIAFEIMVDRTTWPERIRGLAVRPAGERNAAAP
jgi:hypothetical protein